MSGPQFPLWPGGRAEVGGGKARGPAGLTLIPIRGFSRPRGPIPSTPTRARPGAGPGRGPELVKTPVVSESSSFPTPEGRQALYRSIITRSQMVFWELPPLAPRGRPHSLRSRPRH